MLRNPTFKSSKVALVMTFIIQAAFLYYPDGDFMPQVELIRKTKKAGNRQDWVQFEHSCYEIRPL